MGDFVEVFEVEEDEVGHGVAADFVVVYGAQVHVEGP